MLTRWNHLYKSIGCLCAGIAALFFSSPALAVTYYSWSQITLANGYSITPNSGWHVGPVMLNNNDQIAGTATNPSGALRAFIYAGGETHDLGLLPGAPTDCGDKLIFSIANGFNDQGKVVGEATYICGGSHAFMSNGGTLVDLGAIDGGQSNASGINNADSIVGTTETLAWDYTCQDPLSSAFIYQGSKMTDLGLPAGGDICLGSTGLAINNAGIIFGRYGGNIIVMDPGSAGGGWTNLGIGMALAAVNDSGQIAGYVDKSAYIYNPGNGDSGELLYLGNLASYPGEPWCSAIDINNSGVVVGTCRANSSENVATAWVYSNGVMTDLNELLVTRLPGTGGGLNLPDNLLAARSINNAGKILAQGTLGYYLLTPTTYSTPPNLSITKSHSGNFLQGEKDKTYTVTVSNAANAGPTVGPVRVIEDLPPGLIFKYMTGNGWGSNGTVCERWQFDPLPPGTSYPPITVHVDVADDAASPQINQVSVQSGGVTKTATDPTIIISPLAKLSSKPATTYSNLHEAYVAANDNDLLMARNVVFSENPLNLNRPISINISGGLESDFTTVYGFTSVNGSIVIGGSATVTLGNVAIY
jgi:probable HAF family extracellular repeat protein